jgi:predicted DNA-binding ArsR family transcriptional regulator
MTQVTVNLTDTFEDQLDMIYHAGLGGDEFQEAIKIVKNKYPK